MSISRRDFLKGSAWAATLLGLPAWTNGLDEEMPTGYMTFNTSNFPLDWSAPADLASTDLAVLALNRLAFGPRAGDVKRVRAMGLDNYVEEQLSPERIDDPETDKLLEQFPTLKLTIPELARAYAESIQAKQSASPVMDLGEALRGFLGLFGVDAGQNGRAMPQGVSGDPLEVMLELIQATVLRQMFSERQLLEVMVDFWSNHFNIYILKNQCKVLKTVDDREVIRPHALGRFSDLLYASAKSPAMLFYLDNVSNVKGIPQENYARELMELHTLGVNGGYTQTDVQEVARCFTGWAVNRPRRDLLGIEYEDAGEFLFDAHQHDDGAKLVLGLQLPAGGGIRDGEQVLDLLAHHPKTAELISRKLVQRFVADDPPVSLVARAADTFQRSEGDIRAVLGTILHSDEFKQSFGQKLKRPLEFIASAVRALSPRDSDSANPDWDLRRHAFGKNANARAAANQPLAHALRTLGQVPFMWQSPNGYPDTASAWINSNNLLTRWNFALALAANKIPELPVDLPAMQGSTLARSPEASVDFWTEQLLHRPIPDSDRAKLLDYMAGETSSQKMAGLVALILASPHFQYR